MPKSDDDLDVAVLGPEVDGGGRLVIRQQGDQVSAGVLHPLDENRPVTGELVTLSPRGDGSYRVESHGKGPAKVSSPGYRQGWDNVFGAKPKKQMLN